MKNDIIDKLLNNSDVKSCIEFLNDYSKKSMNQYEYKMLEIKLKQNSNISDISQQNIKLINNKQSQNFNFKIKANGNNLEKELCLVKAEASLYSGEVKLNRLNAKRFYEAEKSYCELEATFYCADISLDLCLFNFKHNYEMLSLVITKDFKCFEDGEFSKIQDNFLKEHFGWLPAVAQINDPELNKDVVEMLVFNKRIDSKKLEFLSLFHDVDGDAFNKFYDYINQTKTQKTQKTLKA